MHPAMQKRLFNLKKGFPDGVVKYSATTGSIEANDAVKNIIASSGFSTNGLYSMITDGGSLAMEIVILGVCGAAGSSDSPVLLIDATYTNYMSMAERTGRATVSVTRKLHDHGKFSLPDINDIEDVIKKHKPGAMVVIPYDNPTGHFCDHKTMVKLGNLCEKYSMWMISDEAYRELHYVDHDTSSIWGLDEIAGRRISIETASKVWNACGLRVGAIVTDNKEFWEKAVAEYTANLCSNVIGQYIFAALAHEEHKDLNVWYQSQRKYYSDMMSRLTDKFKELLPGIIVSSPDASIYTVVDVRKIVKKGFNAKDFVMFCASRGNVDGFTLLVSPMAGFYNTKVNNPGKTQMRIAFVEQPELMEKVPRLFSELIIEYDSQ